MKIALLKYSNSTNIGDNIQSLAVEQHLDQEYSYVDRDFMNLYKGDKVVVVMNGWFSHEPKNWPPSPSIIPIFFGFHMSTNAVNEFEKHKAYFVKHAPIGCRDEETAKTLNSWGIETYITGCATMTFPQRKIEPKEKKMIIVDYTSKHLLSKERRGHIKITHEIPIYLSTKLRFMAAKELLNFYRTNAGLIITSRIHCAIPCAAIGIPVVYTGVKEGRTDLISMLNIPFTTTRRFPRTRLSNLPAVRRDFEELKKKITTDLHSRLNKAGIKTKTPE